MRQAPHVPQYCRENDDRHAQHDPVISRDARAQFPETHVPTAPNDLDEILSYELDQEQEAPQSEMVENPESGQAPQDFPLDVAVYKYFFPRHFLSHGRL